MTVVTSPKFVPPLSPVAAGRGPYHYTLERYNALIEGGFLDENDRVELIFGELINTMPIGKRHRNCVNKINRYFVIHFSDKFDCSPQNPLALLNNSVPEPDYAIVDQNALETDYGAPEGGNAHLVVEVSDTTLEYDRTVKTALYALAGIPEYWIINLQQNQVEIHLEPDTETGTYNYVRRYAADVELDSPFCGKVMTSTFLPE